MRLIKNGIGISKLVIILLLLISFLLGAVLSYIWTMGFYAPSEFNIPSQTNLTIENVQFYTQSATFFIVTLLNPSYSPSKATVQQIKVETEDGLLHSIVSTTPPLPQDLARGESQTFKSVWNWGDYANQKIKVMAFIAEGSGATFETTAAFMNLTIAKVLFEPAVTVTRFNVTLESMNSPISLDIDKILVNRTEVGIRLPQTLPFTLNPNASVTFTLNRDWRDLQNKTVTVEVNTAQGYRALKPVSAPPPVVLTIENVVFNNATSTQHFNITVHNGAYSPASVNITDVTVSVQGTTVTITNISLIPSEPLQPNSSVIVVVYWDWSGYQGKSITVTINVNTSQGFIATTEAQIP